MAPAVFHFIPSSNFISQFFYMYSFPRVLEAFGSTISMAWNHFHFNYSMWLLSHSYFLLFLHLSVKLSLSLGRLHGPWLGEVALQYASCVRVLQRNRTKRNFLEKIHKKKIEKFYEIRRAERSHNLLSTNWRPRKASGVIRVQRPETTGAHDVNPRLKAGEDEFRCPSSCNEAGKRGWISPSLAFCSIQAFNRLDDAHTHWGGQPTLRSPPVQRLI